MDHPLISLLLLPVPFVIAPIALMLAMHRRHNHPSAPRVALEYLFAAIALNMAIPLLLHELHIPISRFSQQIAAGLIAFAVLPIAAWNTWRFPLRISLCSSDRRLLAALIILIPLLLPWSCLTGIDTYKWQDFASAVVIGKQIPWLHNHLGLFGLVPRSYPTAFPLLLASCQLPANGAIQPGFAVASLLVGTTALLAAYQLGRRLFPSRNHAVLFATLYALSPVMLRYAHWATGRGLFLAIYPLLLAATTRPRRRRAMAAMLGYSFLLLLCHKSALVAVPLALGGALICRTRAPQAPSATSRTILAILALLLFAVLWRLSPGLIPLNSIPRLALTRYHLLLPLALIGFALRPPTAISPAWRAMLPALLVAPSLAFDPAMYGALVVLPHIAAFATAGIAWLEPRVRNPWPTQAIIVIAVLAAIVTVAHRAHSAASPQLRTLAHRIDQQATGPILLQGAHRRHAQAYVLAAPGCWTPPDITITGIQNPFAPGLSHRERVHRLRWLASTHGAVEWVAPDAQHIWITDGGMPAPPAHAVLLAKEGPLRAYTIAQP
jgi:hypothetical protein